MSLRWGRDAVRRTLLTYLGVAFGLVLVLVVAVAVGASDSGRDLRMQPAGEPDRGHDDQDPLDGGQSDPADDAEEPARNTEPRRDRSDRPEPPDPPEPEQPADTFLVTRVVDGDTLELGNGETVRLVGIDTPEVGECGFERSAARLGELVLGEQVRLGTSDEDRDRYDRLLRYVDVGRTDAGLTLIEEGLAVARYDSRDGYGFHPREPRYIAADRDSRPVCANPQPFVPQQPEQPEQPQGGGCAPGYSPCVPPYPPDVNCADVGGPISVTGSDPHGLDRDGDGIACE